MKINDLSGEFSIYSKQIKLNINGEIHDISNLFPKHDFSNDELLNPEIAWKVRGMMQKVIIKYLLSIDETFDATIIV